jgi:hypothetical protein
VQWLTLVIGSGGQSEVMSRWQSSGSVDNSSQRLLYVTDLCTIRYRRNLNLTALFRDGCASRFCLPLPAACHFSIDK